MKEAVLLLCETQRILWFEGSLQGNVAPRVRQSLYTLNRQSDAPIHFYLWSDGGLICEAFKISRMIDESRAPVVWIGFNAVASAALAMIQSGHGRYALPRTRLVFHQGRLSQETCQRHLKSPITFNAEEFRMKAEALYRLDGMVLSHLYRNTNDTDAVEKLFDTETAISVAHAIRLGMIDGYFNRQEFVRDRRLIRQVRRASKE